MKKIFKIVGIIIVVLIIGLILAPILFRGQLEDLLKKTINKNLNATVAWEDLDLSLFKSFPQAALTIQDFSVVNKAPFEGDTLAKGAEARLDMGIMQLFKSGGKPIKIDQFILNDALINIEVDSLGRANYDIAIKNEEQVDTASAEANSGAFQFDVQHYEINDSRVNYLDQSTKTFMRLTQVNHEGTGDFSADVSNLETHTEAQASFDLDDVNYLNNHTVKLDADFEMDLQKQRYTFKENEAFINQLPLVFEGFVQINENDNDIDLSFKTPDSDFKNFLAVIPETYAKNLDGVETTGDFRVSGKIKGKVDEEHIPTLDISIASNNAAFKYPDLPKKVENIVIDAQVLNETGLVDDTYLRLGNLTFKIDQDVFAANGRIDRLTTNPLVDLALKGRLNLANLEKAYPLELDQDFNGILNVDMTANFDMESVEKERYQNIKTTGKANLKDFNYASPELPKPISIAETDITFNPGTITLNKMQAKTGNTDLQVTGSIDNLIPFLVSDQDLKGRFNVNSNTINLNDFMVSETKTVTDENASGGTKEVATGDQAIKIPSFLDAELNFKAGKVIYDDLVLENASGNLTVRDEAASINDIQSSIFGGKIALNGNVSTKTDVPTFGMKLDLSDIDIDQSFEGLDLLRSLAPIAKALQGALNTTIHLNGNLNNDLTPVLTSLAGDAFAQLLGAELETDKMPLLTLLDSKLDFINLDKIDLNKLKTNLTFKDGLVSVKPFDFNIKGIKIGVSGSHSFQNEMNYNLSLDMPGKYLGSKVGGTLAQLSNIDLDNFTVELPINISGSFNSPKVAVNTEKAVTELTSAIVATQKDKLQAKGEEKVTEALGKLLGNKTATADTVKATGTATKKDTLLQSQTTQKIVKDVLGGLLNKTKKKQDTTGN
ncbi:MAG: AsmA family protein [Cytophagaceae bacterium]|nr:AsmA family protein [Cytophagaceae bacterium]|tara:strand:- start:9042 stop:11711 length:2670 start_codon:yes stop_codon:yes gene_type:complete